MRDEKQAGGAFGRSDLYVSPEGDNRWSGRLAEPNADRTDGPLATIQAARDIVRRRKGIVFSKQAAKYSGGIGEPFTVWIRNGRYHQPRPLVFDDRDSAPVTYAAYPGERPVIDGAVRITGWRKEKVNGTDAWVADLPEVAAGRWQFRELFVNGERRSRPRYPRDGLLPMESVPGLPATGAWQTGGGWTKFVARTGDLRQFAHPDDIEVVYVHFWIEERSPLQAYDPDTRLVTMSRPSTAPLYAQGGKGLADYYLDNVFDQLSEPGQWYLDRHAGTLYYLPKEGEDPETTEVMAPTTLQLLVLQGNPEENRFVEFLRFKDLTFAQTDWRHPDASDGAEFVRLTGDSSRLWSRRFYRGNRAAAGQAAADVPGVIMMEAARHCAFIGCTVENVGWYGFQVADGCSGVIVRHCTIRQTGAGGVKIGGAAAEDPVCRRTGNHAVVDNEISAGGRIFHSAVGVLSMHAFNVEISHNHISDYYYTGISCGWNWGYMENVSRDNRIEKNHIHNLGQGVLSDMGGIYTLGVQPGTVLRGNVIHDVEKAHYGGWCIYPDEGSSHLLIENNICYSTNDTIFNQHYGRENIVQNNIFAFGADAILSHGKADFEHNSIRFERNIMLTDDAPIFRAGYGCTVRKPNHRSDLNLMWDVEGRKLTFKERDGSGAISLDGWRELGHDHHSLFEDPKMKNPKAFDFSLAADSPAFGLGFVPIDTSDVGPRPRDDA